MRRVVAGLAWGIVAFAVLPQPLRASTDALVQLCKVWSAVKFLDPQLMTQRIDWDGALLRAIPASRAATTNAQSAAAIATMLGVLDDPATRVARAPNELARPQLFSWDGDVLIINIGPYVDAVRAQADLMAAEQSLKPELAKARAVVIDLRTESGESPAWLLEEVRLVAETVPVPPQRFVFRSGYPEQPEPIPGVFYSALQVVGSNPIRGAANGTHVPSRIVLITGDELSPKAAALWWSGKAAIVSTRPTTAGDTQRIELGNGITAYVRVGQSIEEGLTPDTASDDASALTKALALARDDSPLAPRSVPRVSAAAPLDEKEKPYAEMVAPDVSYRLLGLFRLWSVIDRFYPFKNLIGDWDAVLREFIPRFETAEGADAYARTVIELSARIEDGHVQVTGPPAVWDVVGARSLPLEVRPVEGRFIVTAKAKELPADIQIAIGDEIVTVDGEPLADRVKRLWKYFPASTEEARRTRVVERAVRGPRDSVADLGVRDAGGNVRDVKIARVRLLHLANDRPVWRVLDHKIGYIDLTRLLPRQVDEALDAVKNSRALIFDMRGYPTEIGYSTAARINRKNATAGALFIRPQISPATPDQSNARYSFEQRLESTDKPKYTAPTAMLIDDRTFSQGELTALWFQAASGTAFIGSNSAGEDGVTTATVLPGGIEVVFTGDEFRPIDGRRLQRVGIAPDVRIKPTIRGIRSGKDEVLDAAVAYLSR